MRGIVTPRLIVAAAMAFGAAMPFSASAQDTASSIRGRVVDASGQPIAGAQVEVYDARTGTTTSLKTSPSGGYNASGLRVGGPYKVTVKSDAGEASETDVYLVLGDSYQLDLAVGAGVILQTVNVYAKAPSVPNTAIGPAATYSREDLEKAPAINRDIKDLIRIDPRIYIDEAFADGIQCGGASSRFNSLTVDGVKMNDNFGLNSNGYPTERMPFPYEAIDQVAVELAPFDAQYGGFSACNINAVTKSGSNEFHGSVFYDYTDDSLSGDKLEGDPVDLGDFDEERYGFTVGGPIVKNKLFFFAAYEKLEGADTFSRGPVGSGAGNEVQGVSLADYNEILDIAQNVYGYDPGDLPGSIPVEDEKLLVKLDWYINANHRASFTYNYNDGFHIAEADTFDGALEFSNHYYERGAELNAYVGQLFSDWTDRFSTELKLGYSELENRQLSLAGTDFGEVQISTFNPDTGAASTVFLGADDSRHANKLSYDTTNVKLAGNYLLGNHVISGGYELESLDVFNLFIQEAEGEYRFGSVDDFRNGTPYRITYENAAFTNNPDDAAANFQYDINTVYLQDAYRFEDVALTIVGGLRYDWYTTNDEPTQNNDFFGAYGFSNSESVDGIDLLQPRLGFNWIVSSQLEVHGGVGLYSGGNPNVWISNNYSNDGVTQIENQFNQSTGGDPNDPDYVPPESIFDMAFTGDGDPIYDIPQDLYDAVAAGQGRAGGVNVLDPDFEAPSEWKYAIGTIFYGPQGYRFTADYLYTDKQDAAIVRDISRVQVGQTADGRPIYGSVNGRSQDFMLTNVDGDSGYSQLLSLGVDKSYDFGFSWALGYAYNEAKDVNPMTSSVAYSNYANVAVADSENPGVATSNYEIPHRFTLKLDYEHAFFGNYLSQFTAFTSYNEGRPYSYVFDNLDASVGDTTFADHQLLYMPTGVDDPNVVFGPDFDTDAFFAYAEQHGLMKYAGRTVPRNAFYSDWWLKVDLKFEQELPGFRSNDRASMFVIIKNFTNLLNDDWGVQYEAAFPRSSRIVNGAVGADGAYNFNTFYVPTEQSRVTDASLYEIRLGVRYDF